MRYLISLPASTSTDRVRRPVLVGRILALLGAIALQLGAFPIATAQQTRETYPVHPDAKSVDGVPRGKVIKGRFENSSIFPGTTRDYAVYVPEQYDGTAPAALMVFQDGLKYVNPKSTWQLPNVFDNLIHRNEMPVTIAVCINPGIVSGPNTPDGTDAQHRFNRSFEYDTVSDRYARFVIEEIVPEVEATYRITDDPNLRGIGGSSSGAIAAFGVAWHRPDSFRRVFSTVGTFVGLRGGNEYPTMIRHTEPKPLRIFLQDGRNDLNIYGGSWWNANQTMLSALQWAGYQVRNEWGEGGHNGKHGSAIFPDAMRWLWQDFDRPITTNVSDHPEVNKRLLPGHDWQLVSSGHKYTEGPAVAPNGDVYFIDGPAGEIWKTTFSDDSTKLTPQLHRRMPGVSGLMFDVDGNLYCARNRENTVTRINTDGSTTELSAGVSCNDLVVVDHGVYFTGPIEQAIWYVPLEQDGTPGKRRQVGKLPSAAKVKLPPGPAKPNGLIVTPDHRFLQVVDAEGRYVWSYRINTEDSDGQKKGELEFGQPYFYVQSPHDAMKTGGDGATMTVDGELLVATTLGIQVFDQPGRAHLITSRPSRSGKLSNCTFAGPGMDWLYVTCGKNVYRRKTAMKGIAPWQPKVVPPKPRL